MSGLMGNKSAGTSGRTAAKTSTLQASYRITTAIEGLAIPMFWGRTRLEPNIFFAWDWVPVANWTEPPGQGGMGGLFTGMGSKGGSIGLFLLHGE